MNNVTRTILNAFFQAEMQHTSAERAIEQAKLQLEQSSEVKGDVINHLRGDDEQLELARVLQLSPLELVHGAADYFGITEKDFTNMGMNYVGVGEIDQPAEFYEQLKSKPAFNDNELLTVSSILLRIVDQKMLAEGKSTRADFGGPMGPNGVVVNDVQDVYRQRLAILAGALMQQSMMPSHVWQRPGLMNPVNTNYNNWQQRF